MLDRMDDERAEPQPANVPIGPDEVLDPTGADGAPIDAAGMVESPAKVMRIGSMVKQLLDEVRTASLDEPGRTRLREIYEQSVRELETALSDDLSKELDRMSIPFGEGVPTESELRVAQAQLVGWLEGLFHGIQATLMAQQMAARAQLDELRTRQLPGPDSAQVPRAGTYL
jgi:hypothetical protein